MDFNFLVGGEAGQGVQSMGYILARSMAKGGYSVLASQDYESRVRGGHNFFAVRVGDYPVQAVSEEVNLLIALNEETIRLHKGELTKDGLILYDGERGKMTSAESALFSVPFERLALEQTGNRIMGNTVALGAALCLVKYDFEILSTVLRKTFGKKGREIAEKNVDAARAGYDFVREREPASFKYRLAPVGVSRKMVINGGEAVALGALAAGCKFMSGYPMTPSTGILQYFAGQSDAFNVVFEQAEDEIAAINMVLGASYAGVRAMTATSGGGFSLMVESLSLAGMTETPVVIVLGQRVGPATGLPTRTEQGELEFAIHAGHGMFPRVIFAPGTVEEAFYLTAKAFNLAEKYQVPVILLTDTYLTDMYTTAEFDLSKITVDRGIFLSDEEVHALGKYRYMRHKLTPSGVSPRVIPGQADALVVTDSDEHTEDGHITESAEVRIQMVYKRLKKMNGLRAEIGIPHTYGPKEAETVLACWGSTYGALREAVDRLNNAGAGVRMIQMSEIWPFPRKAFMDAIKGSRRLIVVEGNAMGQMAHLIRAETGVDTMGKILRFDGRPLTPAYIVTEFQEAMA
jgi:2-oxoglutarate ferredoxin oxidoreductase subunit alpha